MKNYLYDIFEHWGTNIYVYSDPHFSETESYELRGLLNVPDDIMFAKEQGDSRPYDLYVEERVKVLDEMQIKNINSIAGKASTLIILGDVGNIECVKKLKARNKILIMGNHDKGASNYKRNFVIKELSNESVKEIEDNLSNIKKEYLGGSLVGTFVAKVEDNHLFDEVYEGSLMINDKCILSHEPIFPTLPFVYNVHGHVHNAEYKGDEHHLNCCAEAIDYKPINLLKLFKTGKLKYIDSIHRMTIDNAVARKKLYNK